MSRKSKTTTTLLLVAFASFVFLLSSIQAQVQATLQVGSGPIAVAANPATNKIYVANQTSNDVTVIDGGSNAVIKQSVPVGANPRAIAVNANTNTIYVADEGSVDPRSGGHLGDLAIIDGNTDSVIQILPLYTVLIPGNPPTLLPFDADSIAVNPATNEVIVGSGQSGCEIAIVIAGSIEYHSDFCGPMAVTTSSGLLYAGWSQDDAVTSYNSSNSLIKTYETDFAYPCTPNPPPCSAASYQPVGFAAAGQQIYVVNQIASGFAGALEIINEATGTIGTPARAGNNPYAIAVNPALGREYVANQGESGATVTVFVGPNPIATVPVGSSLGPTAPSCPFSVDGPKLPSPSKIAVNSTENTVYVVNECSNDVSVLEGLSGNLIQTVPVGNYPFAAAFDSVNNSVYVANFNSNTVSILGALPKTPGLVVQPTALAFGPQVQGTASVAQIVNLINNGTADVQVSSISPGSNEYSETDDCLAAPIHPGSTCTVFVTYTPAAAAVSAPTQLTITANDPIGTHSVALSGMGTGPGLTFSPSSLNFGSQPVNTFSSVLPLVVSNQTTDNVELTNFPNDFNENDNCAFAADGNLLIQAGQSCTLEVDFQPSVAQSETGQFVFTDTANGTNYPVIVSGTGTTGDATLLGSNISFGSQAIGSTSVAQVVTLTNRNFPEMHPIPSIAGGDFAIASENCSTRPVFAGTSCEVMLTFTPQAAGIRVGQLTLSDGADNSQNFVSIVGYGMAPGVIVGPSVLSYGTQSSGVASPSQSVIIQNATTADLVITATSIVEDSNADYEFAANNCAPLLPATSNAIAPGGTCMMQITYAPGTFGHAEDAHVLIWDNAPSSPQIVSLAGAPTGLLMTVNPSSLNFSGMGQSAVAYNQGYPNSLIQQVGTIGNFTESDNCGAPSTKSSCVIEVTFPQVPGVSIGQITIDDPKHPTVSPAIVALSGSVAVAGVNTSLGNTAVTPVDSSGSGTSPVTVTFDDVTQAGNTTLAILPAASCPAQPTGQFELGTPPVCYDISTTASFSGQATICVNYSGITYGTPSSLVLSHFENGMWVPRTVYNNPALQLICAQVTSFSPFEVFQKVTDTTPPVIVPVITGTLGANGWYTSDVSLTWNVNDPESAISSSMGCGPASVTSDTTGTTFTCTATSAGGTASNSVTIKRDARPPSAMLNVTSGTLGASGWYTSNVTVSTTGADSISPPVMCSAPQVLTTETAGQIFNGSCTDQAGLMTNAAPLTVKLDRTAPAISIASPSNGGVFTRKQLVTASYSCSDSVSGVANCVGPVSNGSSIDTSSAGPKTFTVNAMDVAGNTTSQTVSYQVVCHYLTITPMPSSIAQGGIITVKSTLMSCADVAQTIAIRFTLTGPGEDHSCSRSTTEMFTTPSFLLPANTLQSFSFPFRVPNSLCSGTYSIQSTILLGGQAVDSSTATLTVTPR